MIYKKTKLYQEHLNLKGNMVPFSGFLLPTHYTSIKEEHLAVRNSAGLFDVSHMGEILIDGPESERFLNYVSTNDVNLLTDGRAQYSLLCNSKGGILDDIIIYRKNLNSFMLVVNAVNKQKILDWLNFNNHKNVVKITDVSDKLGLLALQGPNSLSHIKEALKMDLSNLSYYSFCSRNFDNSEIIISRTGYTGELGYEFYIDNSKIKKLWNLLLGNNKKYKLKPAGLACRDTLRIEMKYSLYGNDIDENINPIESGLSWLVKFDKDDFIGKESLIQAKRNPKYLSVCLIMIDRAIPRKGYKVYAGVEEIGVVTSGTISPSLQKGIAIARIKKKNYSSSEEIQISVRGVMKLAKIIKPPFYKAGTFLSNTK